MSEEIRIADGTSQNRVLIDTDNYLRVKDIEKWITGLVPLMWLDKTKEVEGKQVPMLLMKDPETGAKFAVVKVRE